MNHEIPAPGPQTIMTGKGFIASVNRVAEFIRQWQRPGLTANRRRDGVIYALHTDPAGEPIELTVDDLEAVLKRALPVMLPSRDDLARALFVADNWRQPEAAALAEWADITEGDVEQYTHKLADAAIEAFRKANR